MYVYKAVVIINVIIGVHEFLMIDSFVLFVLASMMAENINRINPKRARPGCFILIFMSHVFTSHYLLKKNKSTVIRDSICHIYLS